MGTVKMRGLAVLVLFSVVANSLAQDNKHDDVIDEVHNFRLEYHPDGSNYNGNHLLMAISDLRSQRECHVIEVDRLWEPLLRDQNKIPEISEEINHLIQGGHAREVRLTEDELFKNYGKNDATEECANHIIRAMIYTPSQAVLSG